MNAAGLKNIDVMVPKQQIEKIGLDLSRRNRSIPRPTIRTSLFSIPKPAVTPEALPINIDECQKIELIKTTLAPEKAWY